MPLLRCSMGSGVDAFTLMQLMQQRKAQWLPLWSPSNIRHYEHVRVSMSADIRWAIKYQRVLAVGWAINNEVMASHHVAPHHQFLSHLVTLSPKCLSSWMRNLLLLTIPTKGVSNAKKWGTLKHNAKGKRRLKGAKPVTAPPIIPTSVSCAQELWQEEEMTLLKHIQLLSYQEHIPNFCGKCRMSPPNTLKSTVPGLNSATTASNMGPLVSWRLTPALHWTRWLVWEAITMWIGVCMEMVSSKVAKLWHLCT